MQTIAQYLDAKGYRRGWRKGREQGREEGREEAREEAREEGRKEGLRFALRQVVLHRFKKVSAATDAKIASGDVDALLGWLDRALTARSLKQVFTAH